MAIVQLVTEGDTSRTNDSEMAELTIGYVAGLIALGIVIGQFSPPLLTTTKEFAALINAAKTAHLWCPNALNYVLAGILHDSEPAATWYGRPVA